MGRRRADFYPKMYILVYARYIELNPVRAGLAKKPEAWPLSSAGPHIESRDDLPVKTKPLCTLVQKSWREFWHMTFRNRTSNGYGNTNGLDGHWEGMRLLKKRNYFVYQSKLRCFLSRDELTGEQHLQDFLAAHCSAQRHHRCGTKKTILTPGVANAHLQRQSPGHMLPPAYNQRLRHCRALLQSPFTESQTARTSSSYTRQRFCDTFADRYRPVPANRAQLKT